MLATEHVVKKASLQDQKKFQFSLYLSVVESTSRAKNMKSLETGPLKVITFLSRCLNGALYTRCLS